MRSQRSPWATVLMMRRRTAAFCAMAGLLALGITVVAESDGGLVPCALCLLERWPYRVLIALGAVGAVLPRSFGGTIVALGVVVMLASVGLAGVHVGVEHGWWASPLPECAAPHLDFQAGGVTSLPAFPAKPCDDPSYLVPGLPVSMAEMNALYALAVAVILAILAPRTRRPASRPTSAAKADIAKETEK